ncbi:MAG: molecular chaperone TorD family protein [Deltaproteobacteria bacterium]|nr:molecular chaperone TorD family protein [Candidatus Anaeroferrophillus wilburensis]MBN2887869.1 molecular chaperone TorD family protein [Deltaproteobacteria bacterium]
MINRQDIARSAIYKYLSLATDYPSGMTAEILGNRSLFKETERYLQELPAVYQPLAEELLILEEELAAFAQLVDLQVTYTTHFDLAVNTLSFSLYESANIMPTADAKKIAAFLADLEALYSRQGIVLSDRDMPDHLATELEFMHFLCTNHKTEQQAAFLFEHVANWTPKLAQSIFAQATIPFYARLLMVTARFVEIDRYYLSQPGCLH